MLGWSRCLMQANSSTIPWTPGGKHRHERQRPQYRPDAGEPALRRKNPFRRRVPLAGGALQKALPHAWRCGGVRRAEGKPERAQARSVHQGRDLRAKADSGLVGRSAEVAAGDEMICFLQRFAAAGDIALQLPIERAPYKSDHRLLRLTPKGGGCAIWARGRDALFASD